MHLTSSLHLRHDPLEVARARRWLADVLEEQALLDADRRETTLLMASELVTNAIVHTDSAPVISVSKSGNRIRVGVQDDDPRPPQIRDRPGDRSGGNGLRIVEAWSAAWGTEASPGGAGKVVWFAVDRW